MLLSEQLSSAMEESGPRWDRNPDGSYEGHGFRQGKVTLTRDARRMWYLTVAGQPYALGKKASFTTAERKLAEIG